MENFAICKKCHKQIQKSSILLHEAQCRAVPQVNNSNRNTRVSNGFENEYSYCQRCDNYIPKNEFSDHKLSHQFADTNSDGDIESEEEEVNDERLNLVNRINPGPITRISKYVIIY